MEFKVLEHTSENVVFGFRYNSHILGDWVRRITSFFIRFCSFNGLVGLPNVFEYGLEVFSRRLQQAHEGLVVQSLAGVQL